MGDLNYITEFYVYMDWMSQMGYEGEVWKDRLLKPLDQYEHPTRGVTYNQAWDLVEYINIIAKQTAGLALLSGRVHLWVNYAAQDGAVTRYAPVDAFPSMEGEWVGLYDFAVMLASGKQYAGPEILSATSLINQLRLAPHYVINVLSRHGSVSQSMLSYVPAGSAAVKVYRDVWNTFAENLN